MTNKTKQLTLPGTSGRRLHVGALLSSMKITKENQWTTYTGNNKIVTEVEDDEPFIVICTEPMNDHRSALEIEILGYNVFTSFVATLDGVGWMLVKDQEIVQ